MNPTIIQAYNCLTNYSKTCLKKQWTEFVATSLDDSTKEMTSWLLQVVGKSTMKHWCRYLTELNILESHLTRPSAYFSSPKLHFMATNLTKKVSDLQQRRCKPFTNVHSQSPKLKWVVSWVHTVGMTVSLSKFILRYALLTEPLGELTRKEVKYHWGPKQIVHSESWKAVSPATIQWHSSPQVTYYGENRTEATIATTKD